MDEQSDELNLLDMPREILEHIFINFEKKDLLTASHVCKLFASVAETAFALKYAINCYGIDWSYADNKPLHEVMVRKYGESIQNIHVYQIDEPVNDLIERTCGKLKIAAFMFVPKLPMLKNLKEFTIHAAHEWNRDSFNSFINDNAQLQLLEIGEIPIDVIDVLDGRLNVLKTLKWYQTFESIDLLPIRLPSLETLDLGSYMHDPINAACILRAMNCNINLKKLVMENCFDSYDDVINEICSIKSITMLQLTNWEITLDHISKLAAHLPHLSELSFKMVLPGYGDEKELQNQMLAVLSILPNLKKVVITSSKKNVSCLLNYLHNPTAIYQASFDQFNTQIDINANDARISATKDRISLRSEMGSCELYWMKNFNEANLRKVLIENLRYCMFYFKFVNHCDNCTVDLASFRILNNCSRVERFELKSDGPVTINGNVSKLFGFLSKIMSNDDYLCLFIFILMILQATRYPAFLPGLKTLQIHLEQHSPFQLLQNFDQRVRNQIENLSLHGKAAFEHQNVDHGDDIISTLSKFVNLKELNLSPSYLKFDTEKLFSLCPKLQFLHVSRNH